LILRISTITQLVKLKNFIIDPLQFLFVSISKESRTHLEQSIESLGYQFEIRDVQTKKQALQACYKAKYDILVIKDSLPDGCSSDLTRALSSLMPCLIIQTEATTPENQELIPSDALTDISYLPQNEYTTWNKYLRSAISKWENSVSQKVNAFQESRRVLYDKVAAECANQLYRRYDNRVENTLRIILEVLQVSKAYIRSGTFTRHLVTDEVHSPGIHFSDTSESVYEVAIQRPDGQIDYLGVAECLYPRTWQSIEIDLLKSIALLFQENRSEIRRKIAIYPELSITA
jgi:CheY-like chemotaxis protein